MSVRIVSFESPGLLVRGRRVGQFTVAYSEILTAERLRNRRGLRLQLRTSAPVVLRVKRRDLLYVEDGLRSWGVRVVDCWGAILAPTLFDFEEELDREPIRMRQSSDNA